MAGGPGGHEVARIAVKVVPDTSGFKEKLKAFLEKLEKSNKIEIEVELDDKKAEAELKKLAQDLKVRVEVELDAAKVKAELKDLSKNVTVKVKTNVDDLKSKAEIAALTRDRKVNVKTNVDAAGITTIRKSFGAIGTLTKDIGSSISNWANSGFGDVEEATAATTGAFSKMSSVISGIASVATFVFWSVVIGALAGIVVAAGAVAGALALAFAPAAFIGAGIAFALLGKKGGATAAKLKKDFEGVKKTILSVATGAVQPMLKTLDKQLPAVKNWIRSLKGTLKSGFAASSKFVDDFRVGAQKGISNALKGIVGALNNPGLKPAIGGVKSLLTQMGSSIGVFFDTLSNFGPGFGNTLKALGNQLTPMTGALASLLGAFTAVSPDLINRIGTGITSVLQAFSDPNTIQGIAMLANISFDAIVFSLQTLAGALALVKINWDILKQGTLETVAIIESAFNSLVSFFSSIGSALVSASITTWNAIKSAAVTAAHGLSSGVMAAIHGLSSFFSGAFNGIVGTASAAFGRILSAASSKLHAIASAASGVVSSIKGYFSSLVGVVNGVVGAIRSAVGTIKRLASDAAGALSKLNIFGGTLEYGDMPGSGDLPRNPFGAPPSGGIAMGSFQGSLNAMQSEANKLNSSALSSVKPIKSGLGTVAGVATNIYQFGDIIADNVPTEKTIVNALEYADALYA